MLLHGQIQGVCPALGSGYLLTPSNEFACSVFFYCLDWYFCTSSDKLWLQVIKLYTPLLLRGTRGYWGNRSFSMLSLYLSPLVRQEKRWRGKGGYRIIPCSWDCGLCNKVSCFDSRRKMRRKMVRMKMMMKLMTVSWILTNCWQSCLDSLAHSLGSKSFPRFCVVLLLPLALDKCSALTCGHC